MRGRRETLSLLSEEGNEKYEEGRGRNWEWGNEKWEEGERLSFLSFLPCHEKPLPTWEDSCSLPPQTHCNCTIIARSSTKTWPFTLFHDSQNGKDYYSVWIFKLSVRTTIQHLPWEDSTIVSLLIVVTEVSWVSLQGSRSTCRCQWCKWIVHTSAKLNKMPHSLKGMLALFCYILTSGLF